MAELPERVEGIDRDWLESALAPALPDVELDSVRVSETIHGACTKLRLEIGTSDPRVPARMMMKAGFEPHSAAMAQMHVNEMHAYRDFAPMTGANTPRCFAAGAEAGRAYVILEDLSLRSAEFLSLLRPLDFETAAAFLEALARQHARAWGSAEDIKRRFPWLPDTSEASFSHYFGILTDPARFAEFLERPRCAAMPRVLLDADRIRAAHAAMREVHRAMPHTVLHGDMHLGNLYRDADGTPGFLDWQPRLAPWSVDVSYFIVAALDLVDRREGERALLARYLGALADAGVEPPGFEDAFQAYRRDIAWGLLIWMLNGWQFQTEAANTAAAARFAMAAIDHDMFGELGV